ncbi:MULTISPECIES: hypothetical protein [Sinorhizobium]|uniref:Uncharacterized protein n=1 Tax=Sinorhizobium americanum TaxID=194963 RepID=A0A2S3YFZ3_9HYPH|nr:hypothetical protein ATY31_27605 [Sinorhizobium americanum]
MLAIVWLELFVLVAIGILAGFGIGYAAAMVISQVAIESLHALTGKLHGPTPYSGSRSMTETGQ